MPYTPAKPTGGSMKFSALCALFLILPFTALAEDQAPSYLRQLVTFEGTPADYSSVEELSDFALSSNVETVVAMQQADVAICYDPGKKAEAMAYAEAQSTLLDGMLLFVTEDEADSSVISLQLEVGYGSTEFYYTKKIPECSMEWIRKSMDQNK